LRGMLCHGEAKSRSKDDATGMNLHHASLNARGGS
jgi:hypothetical protein